MLAAAGSAAEETSGESGKRQCSDFNSREFMEAASRREFEACLALASVLDEADDNGLTLMHYAAFGFRCDLIADELFLRGASVGTTSKLKNTPLHYFAGFCESASGIAALLQKGAEVEVQNAVSATPLHWAASFNTNPEIIDVFLDEGRNLVIIEVGVVSEERAEIVGRIGISERSANRKEAGIASGPNATTEFGLTPLHLAASNNANPEVVDLLIQENADPNVRDHDGRTPLHFAASRNPNIEPYVGESEWKAKVFRQYLAAETDVVLRIDDEQTLLDTGAKTAQSEIVRLLLSAGAHVGARTNLGQTPRDIAEANGLKEIVRLLSEAPNLPRN